MIRRPPRFTRTATLFSDTTLVRSTESRRERHWELAFEGMRLFDIYRWKEGERMGLPVTGPKLEIVVNELGGNPYADNGVDEHGDIIYERSVAQGGRRNFDAAKPYLDRQRVV